MHVTFSGAAREVTGSCHLLTVGEHTVALDCGMFQGRRAESRAKNTVAARLRDRGYTVQIPAPGDKALL